MLLLPLSTSLSSIAYPNPDLTAFHKVKNSYRSFGSCDKREKKLVGPFWHMLRWWVVYRLSSLRVPAKRNEFIRNQKHSKIRKDMGFFELHLAAFQPFLCYDGAVRSCIGSTASLDGLRVHGWWLMTGTIEAGIRRSLKFRCNKNPLLKFKNFSRLS